jgi:adenylylsulfate kinase-like enzyme
MTVFKGKVCWIIGLAGSGKTTIGNAVYQKLKKISTETILLDGDELRMVFGSSFGYSYDERKKAAEQYGRLCKMLSLQGISVICCAIGMNEMARKWNYQNIENYMEVFINTPMSILEQRDQKGLYSGAKKGLIENVVGVDIIPEMPKNPDLEIINDGREPMDSIVNKIVNKFNSL